MVSGKVSNREVSVKVSANHERCTKQFALNAARNVKFRSSLLKASLFIAENATERKEDFDFLSGLAALNFCNPFISS